VPTTSVFPPIVVLPTLAYVTFGDVLFLLFILQVLKEMLIRRTTLVLWLTRWW